MPSSLRLSYPLTLEQADLAADKVLLAKYFLATVEGAIENRHGIRDNRQHS